jgi:hypothetical protein
MIPLRAARRDQLGQIGDEHSTIALGMILQITDLTIETGPCRTASRLRLSLLGMRWTRAV